MDMLRGGWGPGLLGNGMGAAAGSSYAAETEAIAAAFTTPPTTARKNLIDAAVVALKGAGVWTKLDALYAFAAADSQAAKINWKAPGTYNCTEVNAPAFAADLGFTGASTKYLDSSFNISTAPSPKYVQNSASVFGWSLTAAQINAAFVCHSTTDFAVILMPRDPSNQAFTGLNEGGYISGGPVVDGTGLVTGVRDTSTTLLQYKNGVALSSTPAGGLVSVPPANGTIWFLRRVTANYWTGQMAAGGFGASLSAAEQLALYNALAAYMAGLATDRIAAAFTTPPSAARKTLIQNCVTSLMQANVWDKLDALYAFAAADSQAAKINWVNPGTYNLTEVNAPAFTADLGFTGASTKRLDSTFNPTTAPSPKFVQDSACIFAHTPDNISVNGSLAGQSAGVSLLLYPRHTAAITVIRINNNSNNIAPASSDSTGFWSGNRSSVSLSTGYKNGASIGTDANASVAPNNSVMCFLHGDGGNYWTGKITCGGHGQSLNSTEQTALYNALRTYLTGVGVP